MTKSLQVLILHAQPTKPSLERVELGSEIRGVKSLQFSSQDPSSFIACCVLNV